MRPVCHIVAGPNGAGKSTFALDYLPEYAGSIEYVNPAKMSKEDREVQEASDAATWKAIEAYRTTGDMVPAERNGKPLTPDVWDWLEQDRRQALEDDLAWIARGREASCLSRPSCQKRSSK